MANIFEQVAEFHRAFSLPIFTELTPADDALRELRINLLKEEHAELRQAFNEKDIIEIADALGDMTYIICGTMLSYGMNMAFSGWEPQCALPNKQGVYIPDELTYKLDMIDILMDTYIKLEKHRDYENISNCFCSILTEIDIAANMCGIPFKVVFDEIHRSNMAKLMPDGTVRRRADNKVMKPDGWTPPDIKGVIDKFYKEKI